MIAGCGIAVVAERVRVGRNCEVPAKFMLARDLDDVEEGRADR